MDEREPSTATQRPGASVRRNPLRVLNLVRAVPFILAVLVLGVVALATGHDKSGLPVILFAGLTGLLSLTAWLRRRRRNHQSPERPPTAL